MADAIVQKLDATDYANGLAGELKGSLLWKVTVNGVVVCVTGDKALAGSVAVFYRRALEADILDEPLNDEFIAKDEYGKLLARCLNQEVQDRVKNYLANKVSFDIP